MRADRTTAVAAAALALVALGCNKDRPGRAPAPGSARTQAAPGSARTRSVQVPNTPRPGDPAPSGAACGPHALPPDQHFVAEGLCARVVAYHRGSLRGLVFAPNGDLFAVTHDGVVQRFRDANHDGVYAPGAPESVTWAKTGGDNGHDCVLAGQDLYCGSGEGVKRWRVRSDMAEGGPGEDVVVDMPDGRGHSTHPVLVDGDALYVVSGSVGNVPNPIPKDYLEDRAVVRRFSLAARAKGKPLPWKSGETVVRGVRNLTAIARAPSGRILGIDQGIDELEWNGRDVHDDNPPEPLLEIAEGKAYGWPFCFFAQRIVSQGKVVPPGTPLTTAVPGAKSPRSDAWCKAHVARPISFVQAHSSALAMTFVPPGRPLAMPSKYAHGIFVTLHGSWNRSPATGFKVVWMPADDDGKVAMPTSNAQTTHFPYETIFGGGRSGAARDGEWSWKLGDAGEDRVRPVGVAVSPKDGALYVSSDNSGGKSGGAIYRIALPGR